VSVISSRPSPYTYTMKDKQPKNQIPDYIKPALQLFPDAVRLAITDAIRRTSPQLAQNVTDIRLKRRGTSYLSVSCGEGFADKIPIDFRGIMTDKLFADLVFSLCDGSVYACADTLREGYIDLSDGFRCGVCGRASVKNGAISEVHDIDSVCIRVPRAVPGASGLVWEMLRDGGFRDSVLVYSPPGTGKTTLLRDLIIKLAGAGLPVSVIDSRGELAACGAYDSGADFFRGYPKAEGMVSAVRSMSPLYIVCDELGGRADAEAVLYARSCGVYTIASAHGGSVDELLLRPEIRDLIRASVFSLIVGIRRAPGSREFDFTVTRHNELLKAAQ